MDQRLPELVAVITPARTDIVGVRQSSDTRDKRETIAQALSLIEDGDIAESNVTQHQAALTITEGQISDLQAYLLPVDLTSIAAGSAAAPSLAWGDGDTGFYELSDGIINFTSNGVGVWSFRSGAILPFNAAGPSMLNEAATATNPTFNPNTSDQDTGLGWAAIDQLSLVAGAVEIARATQAVNANQFAVVASGAVTVPDLTGLADPDTGFSWTGANQIDVLTAGSVSWSLSSAKFFSSLSDGPCIANVAANNAVAIFRPDQSDIDTGFAYHGIDAASITVGGIAGLILKELNSGVIQAPVADVAITAFATGGQGSAVALKQSYNVLATVATAGDSVKLPAVFLVDSVIYIKNDGAESADVFPATGDDLGAGANIAVAVGAGESVTFIATGANATWTQLIKPPAATLSFPILADDGTAGAPSYSFTGAPTSGLFRNGANQIEMSIGGVSQWAWFNGFFLGKASGSPLMQNFAASATTPTFLPSNSDLNTGIGSAAGDILSLIAGGVQIAQAKELVGGNQFIVAPGAFQSNANLPSLAFGDGDTGFFETTDDNLRLSVAGVARVGWSSVGYVSNTGGGFQLLYAAPSATVPSLLPNGSDLNTGIGRANTDQLSLIAGSIEGLRFAELNSGVLQVPAADVAITAFATGGQASATTLKQSYNVISVVGTTGDSVKLPSVFAVNTIVHIKNDGANACDVFPFSGDDLGAGTNTAASLAAGVGIIYIATVANATWTPLS